MLGMNTGYEGIRRRHDTARFRREILPNSIVLWIQESPVLTSEEGFFGVFLPEVGGRQDPRDLRGLAHFFEHFPFRGIKGKSSTGAIIGPITAAGGTYDANTSPRRTFFNVTLQKDEFRLALDTVSGLVLEPLMRAEDIQAEQGAILQEYQTRNSEGKFVVWREFLKALFGEHPLGGETLGNPDTIRSISQDDIRRFHTEFYHAGNFHILCGGSFSEIPGVIDIIRERFGNVERRDPAKRNPEFALPLSKSGRVILRNPAYGQDMLMYAYPRGPLDASNQAALNCLAHVLGSDLHSPLMNELRVKRGLVYGGGITKYHGSPEMASFYFLCPTKREHFHEVEKIYRKVLRELEQEAVLKYQRGRQLQRRIMFSDPIEACKFSVEVFMGHGRMVSQYETESIDDAVSLEQVFHWRDILLETEPFVAECLAS